MKVRAASLHLLVTVLFLAALLHAGTVRAQNLAPRVFLSGSDSLPYRLHVPAANAPGKRYPVLVFLHGSSARGSDNEKQLRAMPAVFQDTALRNHYVLVVPQCPGGDSWADFPAFPAILASNDTPTRSGKLVLGLVRQLRTEAFALRDSIFLLGYSMGGEGALDLAAREPSLFAGVAAVAAVGDTARMTSLKNKPVWLVHGSDDSVNPVTYARLLRIALERDEAVLTYTELAGEGHGILNQAFDMQLFLSWMAGAVWTAGDSAGTPSAPAVGQLEEVISHGRKPLIERKADRTVFNVENSVTAAGSDTYDALRKVPGVQTGNGSIGIVGKSSVLVTINDRRLLLSGDELETYLRSIPASEVSRIELITAPPARYDAEGNAGIINIVLKKVRNDGFSGTVGASYQQRTMPSQRVDGRLNYKKGPLVVSLSSNIARYRFLSDLGTTVFYAGQRQEQRALQFSSPFYFRNQLDVDYNLSPTQTVSGQYSYNFSDRAIAQSYRSAFVSAGSGLPDSVIGSAIRNTEQSPRNVAGIYYEWRMDSSGKKLNVDLDYFQRASGFKRDFTSQPIGQAAAGGAVENDRTANTETNGIRSVKADLTLPGKGVSLMLGAKALFIRNTSDYGYSRLENGVYVTDTQQSNQFRYTENTQACYGTGQAEWRKWQAQAGLRVEATQIAGESAGGGRLFGNNYIRLFPSAYLSYKPANDKVWVISYNRRIERPQFGNLNPFRKYITDNSYEAGNPYLQPSLCQSIELSFTYQSSYSVTLFRQAIQNYMGTAPVVDSAARTFVTTSANIGSVAYYGLTLGMNKAITSGWEVVVQLHGNYQEVRSDFWGPSGTFAKPFCRLELNNSFVVNRRRTLLAELGLYAASDQVTGADIRKAYGNLYGGVKYLCFDKRLTLSANFADLLHTDRYQLRHIYNGTLRSDYYDVRSLYLAASWKLGSAQVKGKHQDARPDEQRRAD